MIKRSYYIHNNSLHLKIEDNSNIVGNSNEIDGFFVSDLTTLSTFYSDVLDGINNVLNGKEDEFICSGNLYRLEITKKTSKITDLYGLDFVPEEECSCEIDTKELKELIEEYYIKLQELY